MVLLPVTKPITVTLLMYTSTVRPSTRPESGRTIQRPLRVESRFVYLGTLQPKTPRRVFVVSSQINTGKSVCVVLRKPVKFQVLLNFYRDPLFRSCLLGNHG